jgi:hypothetical protein
MGPVTEPEEASRAERSLSQRLNPCSCHLSMTSGRFMTIVFQGLDLIYGLCFLLTRHSMPRHQRTVSDVTVTHLRRLTHQTAHHPGCRSPRTHC